MISFPSRAIPEVLVLPSDPSIVTKLEAKFCEYQARRSAGPTLMNPLLDDTLCKRTIVAMLLERGSITTDELRKGVREVCILYKRAFKEPLFLNAVCVIDEYLESFRREPPPL